MSERQGRFQMTLEPTAVGELIGFLMDKGMLCRTCKALIVSKTDARLSISQNEICSSCQRTINEFLTAELEHQVREVLKQRGLSLQLLTIGQKE